MERELDYQLLLPQPPLAVKNILGRLPDFCSYPLLLAQLARQYDFEHATLLRQQCIVCKKLKEWKDCLIRLRTS